MAGSERRNTIVVGVDGSDGAQRALAWAVEEARLRSAVLRAVHTVRPVVLPSYVVGRAGGYVGPSREQMEEVGEAVLDEALKAVDIDGGPALERRVVLGQSPAESLVEASRDAELLVVGSRGLGGFRSLVVGSVSLQCVTHATCPVTVVPSPEA